MSAAGSVGGQHPRVLIVEARSPIALHAARALAAGGYDPGVAGSGRLELAALSRSSARHHRLPPLNCSLEPLRQALLRVIAAHRYDVLLATGDTVLARLGELRLPIPSSPDGRGSFGPLMDKLGLAAIADAAGVTYPPTYAPSSPADDAEALRAAGLPAVVKARRSAVAAPHAVRHFPGAVVVRDLDAGRNAIAALRVARAEPIVQRSVHGEKFQGVVIRRRRASTFTYVQKVLREVPREAGYEAALQTIDRDSGVGGEIVSVLETLCDAVGYEGIVTAEFYRTARGQLFVFDVNPRLWGSLVFPERLGLRVTERVVRDALGLEPLSDPGYPLGRRYHNILGEFRWLRAGARDAAALRNSLGARDVYDWPPLHDPLPSGHRVLRGALEAARSAMVRDRSRAPGERRPL